MSEEAKKDLMSQRDQARERAIGSVDKYDIYLALSLSDDSVIELLNSRLKDGVITGATLLQDYPIALMEFEIAPRSGVNLSCSNVMIGIHPETKTVSTDPASMFSSDKEPITNLPFALEVPSYVESISNNVKDAISGEQEIAYRRKVGAPTLEEAIEFDRLNRISNSGLSNLTGFGRFGSIDGFGRLGSASPSGSRYTKCFSTTRCGDGYYVNDDCG